jgi:hypothetical protein
MYWQWPLKRNGEVGQVPTFFRFQFRRAKLKKAISGGVFKPKPTTTEAKSDTTTRVARSIIEGEAAVREAKTARLRRARLAKEAEADVPNLAKRLVARRHKA